MSTKKITALTELSAAPAATDMIPVVDVSDTTDAASGTTKKITATNIAKGVGIGAGNTAAEPVKIDTSTGFVAVGGATPNIGFGSSRDTVLTVFGGTGANNSGGVEVAGSTTSTSTTVGAICFSNDDSADSDKRVAQVHAKSSADDKDEGSLHFATHNGSNLTERIMIDQDGNLLMGGSTAAASSVGNLHLFNGTAPSGNVTNGVILFAQDVSTSELRVRDEAGNVSTLSPHNFDMLGERSDPMAWAYYAKNVFVGKEISVDMMKVIRALEKLTGETYIKIKNLKKSEILDWDTEEKKKEDFRKEEINKAKSNNETEPEVYSKKSKPAWIA